MTNIAKILKDKPKGTALFSVDYGVCYLETVWGNELVEAYYFDCSVEPKIKVTILFDSYGKPMLNGVTVGDYCSLFPSDEMRDWVTFGWKTGDELYHNVTDMSTHFLRFTTDDKTYSSFLDIKYNRYRTDLFHSNPYNTVDSNDYERGDVLFYMDCFSNKQIVVFSHQTKTHIAFNVGLKTDGNPVFVEKNIPISKEQISIIRYATDEEKQLLYSALEMIGKCYDEGTKTIKEIEEKHQFKPFEKVIVRDDYFENWNINFFGYYEKQSDGTMYYHCLNGAFCQCLPLNEETEKLIGTSDNY